MLCNRSRNLAGKVMVSLFIDLDQDTRLTWAWSMNEHFRLSFLFVVISYEYLVTFLFIGRIKIWKNFHGRQISVGSNFIWGIKRFYDTFYSFYQINPHKEMHRSSLRRLVIITQYPLFPHDPTILPNSTWMSDCVYFMNSLILQQSQAALILSETV